MSNNTRTGPQMVPAEAQRIAHEKAIFVGTINREYDDSYAKTGAKIGDTLKVRQPNQYTVSTSSRVMDVQDQDESTISVVMARQ